MPAIALLALPLLSPAQVIYQQGFDNTVNQTEITAISGWNWGVDDNSTRQANGQRQWGGLSDSAGPDGAQGFAYNYNGSGSARTIVSWYDGGGSLSIPQSQITSLELKLGNSASTSSTRFVIRIGADQWFVASNANVATSNIGSATNFATSHVDYVMNFTTDGSAWQILQRWDDVSAFDPVADPSSQTFSGRDASGTWDLVMPATLPAGNITAVGVYSYTGNNASTRFDDFAVVPEPATWAAILGLAALGMGIVRSRLR